MSRIVMSANGSWGDVLPFVPVAHAMTARVHEVEFVVPTGFHDRLGREGFAVRGAGWEVGPDELAALDVDWSRRSGLPMMRAVMRELLRGWTTPMLRSRRRQMEPTCWCSMSTR